MNMKVKDVARRIGLPASASQKEVLAAIGKRRSRSRPPAAPVHEDSVTAALADGRLPTEAEAAYRNLARNDPAGTRAILAAASPLPPVIGQEPDDYPQEWLSPSERTPARG
jgi:hypothetical protein